MRMTAKFFLTALLTAGAISCAKTPAEAQEGEEFALMTADDPLPRKDDKPLEKADGVITQYGSVEVEDGVRLRTFISMPQGTDAPLHPLIFTQWVSCGTIEFGDNRGGTLATLAKDSGLALLRVERAGAGDSQGPSCDTLDYNTEVAHYVAAYDALLKSDLIDASKVYVYGSSLGSTTAPLVADALQSRGHDIEAIAVQGGGGLTHYERMLNFDRLYLERRPDAVPVETIHDEMRDRAAFHVEYLIKGRNPNDIAKDNASMAAVRADIRGMGENDHYGRPFAWHQQATARNTLAAWSQLDAKVLVIFNEFDQFEMRYGHAAIVDAVNRARPGTAKLIEQKGLGHSSWRFNTIEEAYADEIGVRETETTAAALVKWFKKVQ